MCAEDKCSLEYLLLKYCSNNINDGVCTVKDCDWCHVERAYAKIFQKEMSLEELHGK